MGDMADKGGIGGSQFSLTDILVINAMTSGSGGKGSSGGDGEGCWQALAVCFGILFVYYACCFIAFIVDCVEEHPWWALILVLVAAACTGGIFWSIRSRDRAIVQGFLDDFNKWDEDRGKEGDPTNYCAVCRGHGWRWRGVWSGGYWSHDYRENCYACGGKGIRDPGGQYTVKYLLGWVKWWNEPDIRSDGRCVWCQRKEPGYCPWCNTGVKLPLIGKPWFDEGQRTSTESASSS